MVRILGETETGLIYIPEDSDVSDRISFIHAEFVPASMTLKAKYQVQKEEFNLEKAWLTDTPDSQTITIYHVALWRLTPSNQADCLSKKHDISDAAISQNRGSQDCLYLLGLGFQAASLEQSGSIRYCLTAVILVKRGYTCQLLQKLKLNDDGSETACKIYFIPKCSKIAFCREEGDVDTAEEKPVEEGDETILSGTVKVLLLERNISMCHLAISVSDQQPTLRLLKQESVTASFWWSQWLPNLEAIAFAHFRKSRRSSFDDDEPVQPPKPFLTVIQFHKDYPRESVLNMPLEVDCTEMSQGVFKLAEDSNILVANSVQMKLLAHPSGSVYLFRLSSKSTKNALIYSVHMLHHNKTLETRVLLDNLESRAENVESNKGKTDSEMRLDVGLYSKDQYLLVIGWPHFAHFIDAGSHEPNFHLVFTCEDLGIRSPMLRIMNMRSANGKNVVCDEKTDLSPKYSTVTLIVPENDSACIELELNSSVLLPLMERRKNDIRFKLAVLHYFLIHLGDINVSKRIIYDEGKRRGNLHLKLVYQEFLIGHTFLQTKKQILPTLDSFLYLIPYSADPDGNSVVETPTLTIQMEKCQAKDVSIMLLTPSQRVFPHNITDIWNYLWSSNRNFSRSRRFNHKEIAQKLVLSLQCYKPEALSRASTPGPMSPSSPMICNSLGDIVGMFGRRITTELQLPFVEHESCTANKQEYVFSINLREMSMHFLKERKEWPVHGQTVAGKYVSALGESARLLCHLVSLTAYVQPANTQEKGFPLIDGLSWEIRFKLFMLMEHYALALGTLAIPLPQGFTPFFAYLGYRVLTFEQFMWHIRSGTFDLQIDLVKRIMGDMKDDCEENVQKKLQLLSLLPKTRANRILNSWSNKASVTLRARQHACDLLSGSVAQGRRRMMASAAAEKKKTENETAIASHGPLDTFLQLLTAKANASEIDVGLLTEATLVSMKQEEKKSSRQ